MPSTLYLMVAKSKEICFDTMLYKILVACCVLSVALGKPYPKGGLSSQYRKQGDDGSYQFGYNIVDGAGAKNYRKESGDKHGNKYGSYGILGADGRLRIVEYVADKHGFRAKIRTNEPGTTPQDSADATVNGPDQKIPGESGLGPSNKFDPPPIEPLDYNVPYPHPSYRDHNLVAPPVVLPPGHLRQGFDEKGRFGYYIG